jgi:hypothetical protein
VGCVDTVLARLEQETITPLDGRRASELSREAGRQSNNLHRRIHEVGPADALVGGLAERLGALSTCDSQHMEWLREAGARITDHGYPGSLLTPGDDSSFMAALNQGCSLRRRCNAVPLGDA